MQASPKAVQSRDIIDADISHFPRKFNDLLIAIKSSSYKTKPDCLQSKSLQAVRAKSSRHYAVLFVPACDPAREFLFCRGLWRKFCRDLPHESQGCAGLSHVVPCFHQWVLPFCRAGITPGSTASREGSSCRHMALPGPQAPSISRN